MTESKLTIEEMATRLLAGLLAGDAYECHPLEWLVEDAVEHAEALAFSLCEKGYDKVDQLIREKD